MPRLPPMRQPRVTLSEDGFVKRVDVRGLADDESLGLGATSVKIEQHVGERPTLVLTFKRFEMRTSAD